MGLDGRSILNKFRAACGDSGVDTYDIIKDREDDYINHNFLDLAEELIQIMKDEKITDKIGAVADMYYLDKVTIKNFIGDFVYEERSSKEDRISLLKEMKDLQPEEAWKTAIEELEKEMSGEEWVEEYTSDNLRIHPENLGIILFQDESTVIIHRSLGSFEPIISQLAEEITGKSYKEITYGIVEEFPKRIAEVLKVENDFANDDIFHLLNAYVYLQCKDTYPDVAQTAIRVDVEGY